MPDDPAGALFRSVLTYADVERLIDTGAVEDQYLECKAPGSPELNPGTRAQLSEAASGFANSGGGIIIWGVSTDKHLASNLDVLTQMEPIGRVSRFAQQVDRALLGATVPQVGSPPSRVIHRSKGDSKGVLLTYVPPTPGDPVQALNDRKFYIRVGDEFREMPYETLKRMFAGAEGPLLKPLFDERLVKCDDKGIWQVPFALYNKSSAVARDTHVSILVQNPEACARVTSGQGLDDQSEINPGQTIFHAAVDAPIFRGLNQLVGWLSVEMKKGSKPRRVLKLRIRVFADRMWASQWSYKLQLAKTGFSIKDVVETFVY